MSLDVRLVVLRPRCSWPGSSWPGSSWRGSSWPEANWSVSLDLFLVWADLVRHFVLLLSGAQSAILNYWTWGEVEIFPLALLLRKTE